MGRVYADRKPSVENAAERRGSGADDDAQLEQLLALRRLRKRVEQIRLAQAQLLRDDRARRR